MIVCNFLKEGQMCSRRDARGRTSRDVNMKMCCRRWRGSNTLPGRFGINRGCSTASFITECSHCEATTLLFPCLFNDPTQYLRLHQQTMTTSLRTDEAELGSLADFLDTKITALFLSKQDFLIHDTNIVQFSEHFGDANAENKPAVTREDFEFYWWLAVR